MKRYLHFLPNLLALSIDQVDRTGRDVITGPTEIPRGGLERVGPNGTTSLREIIQRGITVIIVLSIVLSLFFLIWGGIQWITSQGDKSKVDAARKKILYAIIGLIVIFLSFFIIITIGNLFNIDILNTGAGANIGLQN